MKSIKICFLTAILLASFNLSAQVNMASGTMDFTVPIYNYSDNLSKLSLSTQISYNSGRGLEIDQVSNSIGTKWNLSGVPVVVRHVNGLPDDQVEKAGNVYDTTKYPAGYLYNTTTISLGCPKALNEYPIFTNRGRDIDNDNSTMADRELDRFDYTLNGTQGSFVIDKNFNAIQLNDSKIKIEIAVEDQTSSKHIRTSIKQFTITDESGLQYVFSEQETIKLYKIRDYNPNGTFTFASNIFSHSYEIPLDQNPFVTTSWYVSKIIDPQTARFISFDYNTVNDKYSCPSSLHTNLEWGCTGPFQLGCITLTTPTNYTYSVTAGNTKGVIDIKETNKKEIKSILFPDGYHIEFNYATDRKDIVKTKMLDDITVFTSFSSQLLKYNLTHNYFVKNEIKIPISSDEEKWSRLCLTAVQKVGNNNTDAENPWKFEYYLGSNSTENFVPPYFFHAKDPWGYYNGDYSGVSTTSFLADNDLSSWAKVCIYNQPHGYAAGREIFFNSKNGYAKNGLLKKITNPYGGIEEYEYEQNYYKLKTGEGNYMLSYDMLQNGDISVGGVHVSKNTAKIDDNSVNDLITKYEYTDDQGYSTLWGVEPLFFQTTQNTYWEAEEQVFNGLSCAYNYVYPGKVYSTSNTENNEAKLIGFARAGLNLYQQLNNISHVEKKLKNTETNDAIANVKQKLADALINFLVNLVKNYIENVFISCSIGIPAPQKYTKNLITSNNNSNGNLLPNLYKSVTKTIYSGNNIQSGKTIYTFTSPDDISLILPDYLTSFDSKPRAYEWMYGLSKSTKIYDNANHLISSSENEYALKKNNILDEKTKSCNCQSFYQKSMSEFHWNQPATFSDFTTANINNNGLQLKVDFYNIITGHAELNKTTEKLFNSSNDAIVTVKNYLFNSINNQVSSQSSVNSKGTTIESKTYYIDDYNLTNPTNAILAQMKSANILTIPIASEVWQTKNGGTPELLTTSITELGIAPNGDYKPMKKYSLQTDKPVPQIIIGAFDPDKLVRNPTGQTLVIPTTEITYNNVGNLLKVKDITGGRVSSTIYGYNNTLPVATINNASADEFAYTSFESDAGINSFQWNWNNNTNVVIDKVSLTGNQYSNGSINSDIISFKNKPYKLTFWAKSNNFVVSPQSLLTLKSSTPTINGWTYYEYDVAATGLNKTISVDANGGGIDEVRLYPQNASISTVTYDLGVGKTSDCDINNRISYYEYDGLGRLVKVLDENHNIIKTYEYHFKN